MVESIADCCTQPVKDQIFMSYKWTPNERAVLCFSNDYDCKCETVFDQIIPEENVS